MVDVKKRNILKYAIKRSRNFMAFLITVIISGIFVFIPINETYFAREFPAGIKLLIVIGTYFIIFIVSCFFLYIFFWIATRTEIDIFNKNEIIDAVLKIEHNSRQGYYASKQIDYINNAERKVRLIIHSLNDENKKDMYKKVDETLRTACLDKGIDVRVLAPFDANCSQGAYQISEYHSVPIKFSPQMNKGSLRFTMMDDYKIIFSIQDYTNPKLSRKYVEIESYELGRALNHYFDDVWRNNSSDFDGFVTTCLEQSYGKSIDYKIAQEELGIPEETLKRITEKQKSRNNRSKERILIRKRFPRMNIIAVCSKVLIGNRHIKRKPR